MKNRFIKEYEKENVQYGKTVLNVKLPNNKDGTIALTNVKYIPNTRFNVIAEQKLNDKGTFVDYDSQVLTRDGEPIILLKEIDDFLVLEDNTSDNNSNNGYTSAPPSSC